MGSVGRYLSGLCVAILGLCAAGWLALAPMAFGYRGNGQQKAVLTDRATGVGLAVVSLVTLALWVIAWRRMLRADGILPGTSRRQARREARARRRRERDVEAPVGVPDPARVLSDLRALLTPLLAEPTTPDERTPDEQAARVPAPRNGPEDEAEDEPARPVVPHARSGGLAAMESMLAGAELLMVGVGEEEAW
jgi:hypothetical protein